jgi:hypothetical protein
VDLRMRIKELEGDLSKKRKKAWKLGGFLRHIAANVECAY